MARKRTQEDDKVALEQKVRAKTGSEHPVNADEAKDLRRLRKRLKRTQRKINGKAARIAMAAGKKSKAAA